MVSSAALVAFSPIATFCIILSSSSVGTLPYIFLKASILSKYCPSCAKFGTAVPAVVAIPVPTFPKPAALASVPAPAPPPAAINKFVAWLPIALAIVGNTVEASVKPASF